MPDGEVAAGLHKNIPESAGLRGDEITVHFKFVEGFAALHIERFGITFPVGDMHRTPAGDLGAFDKRHQFPAKIVKHAVVHLTDLHRLYRGGLQSKIRRGDLPVGEIPAADREPFKVPAGDFPVFIRMDARCVHINARQLMRVEHGHHQRMGARLQR